MPNLSIDEERGLLIVDGKWCVPLQPLVSEHDIFYAEASSLLRLKFDDASFLEKRDVMCFVVHGELDATALVLAARRYYNGV